MNIADVAIILLAMTALVRGTELGLVRQACSAIGLLGGFFLGAFLQGFIVHTVDTTNAKTFLAFLVLASCVLLGMSIGEVVGVVLKARLHGSRLHTLERTDKATGAVVGGVTLLLTVWLCAAIFVKAPVATLQQQIKGSVIIAQLNKTLPEAPSVVSRLGHLIAPNGFPEVFTGLEPRVDTAKPLPSIGDLDAAVQKDRASVVKVEGKGCGGISEGSGFIAATDLVITNAHVVAGVQQPYIVDGKGQHGAEVVWFDPQLDMAVLRSPDLTEQPLPLSAAVLDVDTPTAVLGYPGGGDFTASPATVLESFTATGRDIYNQQMTRRQVYSLKTTVVPGNSGGPLINKDGTVVGLVFAKSATYDQVGYALAMQQVVTELEQAQAQGQIVGTGSCTQ